MSRLSYIRKYGIEETEARMLKAIFAKHVQSGDVILLPGGERIAVTEIEQQGSRVLLRSNHPVAELSEYDIVGLGHRPRPEGKTEGDLLQSVIDRAGAVVDSVGPENIGRPRSVERRVAELGEALETYELGKKLPEVKT